MTIDLPGKGGALVQPARGDRRKERGDKSRAAILKRAMEMAAVLGLEGVTIGRLAADLGVSKGNITALFKSKEILQIATLEAAMNAFDDNMLEAALACPTPLERLQALCEGWFDVAERRPFPGGPILFPASFEYRAVRARCASTSRPIASSGAASSPAASSRRARRVSFPIISARGN
jgi:AcrR family transcriptional regulator